MRENTSSMLRGSDAAATLAAGIGCFVLGLMTTLEEASTGLENSLRFVGPVGPLSGKTTVAVAVWVIAWLVLGSLWRGRERPLGSTFAITLVLIGLGLLLTFPVFFELLAPA